MDSSSIINTLQLAQPPRRKPILNAYIRELLADFLELDDPEHISPDQNFIDLGTDSLQAVSFKTKLESNLECSLRTTLLFDHPSMNSLVDYLIDDILPLDPLPTQPVAAAASALAAASPQTIAIIGLAGQFPGADDAESLWHKAVSAECLQVDACSPALAFGYGRLADKISSEAATEATDRQFWLLSRLIAQLRDEYQISENQLTTPMTGVFIAAQSFSDLGDGGHETARPYRVPIANRLSFQLDLKGPSEVINTFCTSVHVALHRALQSIRSGECEQAIVGAVNLIDSDEFAAIARHGLYDQLLSGRNLTRSFGAEADGFVRSEGAGVIVLKPLQRALSDGNHVLAVVKGSAVHHGGRGYSLEAPNVQGLKHAIGASIAQAGIGTDSIDYVEAHGIGNTLADALELNAINDAYRLLSANPDRNWYVSSVKPSIGHPEIASGMASLIKAVKALQYKTIPGIAGLGAINRELADDHALILQDHATPWQNGAGPRRVALNSYAIGGVNAHIVLEEYCGQAQDAAGTAATNPINDALISPLPASEPTGKVEASLADLAEEVFGLALADIDRSLSPVHYGFDSIQVVQFISRLNERLGLNVKISQAMGAQNFGEFFSLVAKQTPNPNALETGAPQTLAGVPATPQPLSETQKGLWYLQETYPESTAFNVPMVFRLQQPANPDCLRQALLAVLEERPLLRCRFRYKKGTSGDDIVQMVGTAADNLMVEHLTLSAGQETVPVLRQLLRQPFNLENDPPLRLYNLGCPDDQRHYVFFVIHHVVIDGFSGMLLANEFWDKYRVLAAGGVPAAQAPDTAFFDFVAWERHYLNTARAQQDLAWWQDKLTGIPATISLPFDTLPHPGLPDLGMGCEILTLDGATLSALKYLGSTLNLNLSALLLGVFNLLLHRLSGEDDIVVNMPAAGRPQQRHENTVGCYINLLLVRTRLSPNDTFLQLVKQIGANLAEALDHAHFPFARLMPELGLTLLDPGEVPFSVSFTYQNIFDAILGKLQGVELSYEPYQETMDSYMLEVYDFRDTLELHLKFQRNLFEAATIRRHISYLQTLLAAVLEDPSRRLDEYDCLPEQEVNQLLNGFNATERPFDLNGDFYQKFIAQAARCPGNTALVFKGRAIGYEELALNSRRLAGYLAAQGVEPGELVAVCMERSAEMIVAVLGVLAAGGAYLPIDPHNAEDRIRYMLSDAKASLLLTQSHLQAHLSKVAAGCGCRAIAVDDADWLNGLPADAELKNLVSPEHPAYVIYTSGSTGKPKGVVIAHRSLLNLCHALKETYGISERDRILQFASLSFDMSVEEIFPYLLAGASIVIREETDIEVDNFYRAVVDNCVSILNLPPQFYSVIAALEAERQQQLFGQLRLIAFGGEALPEATLKAVENRGVRIFNAYGPTEYTVNAALGELSGSQALTIGKPIANTRLYVLGEQLQLQPIGVAGELYIAGEGLALGYLNNPELSAEKFIDNPYAAGKFYKTGDLARWLENGTLAFVGRNDQQVKIRGFRVELGEIENALTALPGVSSAVVVLAKAPGGDRLAAYYTTASDNWNAESLREALRRSLPDYMLPSAFVRMDALPLTRNGKLDRKLLEQKPLALDAEQDYAAPLTAAEKQLAHIFEETLGLERIGLNDHFFELGGHSLLSIQLVHEINRQLPAAGIGITDLIQCPTVRQLSARIGNAGDLPAASPYIATLSDSIPTFIIPGMPGLSDGYHQLAKQIGDGGPVYGLQMLGYGGSAPAESVAEMAAHNLALIKNIKPRGAIRLYAHSYGGTVAYEMLEQLKRSEIEVSDLVLIDCGVANWPKRLDAASVNTFLAVIFENAGRAADSQKAAIDAILQHRPYAAWQNELANLLQKTLSIAPSYFQSLWQVVETSLAADYRYPHGKLPYQATLVIAEESSGWLNPDSWDDYYAGVRVIYGGGGHFSVVNATHCADWLKALRCG